MWRETDLVVSEELDEVLHVGLVDAVHNLPLVSNQLDNHLGHIQPDAALQKQMTHKCRKDWLCVASLIL